MTLPEWITPVSYTHLGTRSHAHATNRRIPVLSCAGRVYEGLQILEPCDRNDEKLMEENAQKPVSYTHLDVYKRQVTAFGGYCHLDIMHCYDSI